MDVTALQNVDLPASGLRLLTNAFAWPGVDAEGDFEVGVRGAGANMSVDVAGGLAVVDGGARGMYVVSSGGTVNVTVGAAPGAGESRIDLVVLLVSDEEYAGSDNEADVVIVAGTEDPSPVAPAVPTGGLLLAEVLVEDDTVSIGSGAITDRRSPSRAVSEWETLPADGTDGQIVYNDDGAMWLHYGGDWELYRDLSGDRYATQVMPDKNGPFSAFTQWGATLTVPGGTPPQAVAVNVAIAGFVDDYVSMEHVFEISGDGGSTWHRSPVFPAAAYRQYVTVVAAPSGSIQVRVLLAEEALDGTLHADSGCVLTAVVSPVKGS